MISEAAVEAAARGMAIHDDDDGCFLEVDAWNAQEEWEREAYPENYPGSSIEDCAYWIAKARAALKAAAPHILQVAKAEAWDECEAAKYLVMMKADGTGLVRVKVNPYRPTT